MKDEYLKTYKWMNSLRGGVLRDVYALIYQLEHDGRRKGTVKISIGYISERLGYSSRSVQYAIAELKEKEWLNTECEDGKRSVYKALTPANLAPLSETENPHKSCTHANLAPLQILHPTHANLAPLTPYITKDNRLDYSTSTERVRMCARERLTEWYNASTLPEWTEMQFTRNGLPAIDTKTLLDEFYDNDFKVRERCEQSERMEVLSHFQNWLPKYISKIKQTPTNNGNNSNQTSTQRVANLEDIAQSILAGCQAGRASRQ